VITSEDCKRAKAEGLAADVGAENPYAGESLALATLWAAGYDDMLLTRVSRTRQQAMYLQNRRDTAST